MTDTITEPAPDTGSTGTDAARGTGPVSQAPDQLTTTTAPDTGTVTDSAPAGGNDTTANATGQADDHTARTIEAIRGDFKQERAKRQATEQALTELQQKLTQQQEAADAQRLALAKALGVAPDDTPPDPEQLTRDLQAAREQATADKESAAAQLRAQQVELATWRLAATNGADPARLADSRTFMRTVEALDPGSETFSSDLATAIKTAVEANPGLAPAAPVPPEPAKPSPGSATTAPPARSGGEHGGAPQGERQWTKEDVDSASPKEVSKALKKGLLRTYLSS